MVGVLAACIALVARLFSACEQLAAHVYLALKQRCSVATKCWASGVRISAW